MRPRGNTKGVPEGFQPLPGRAPTNEERDATAKRLEQIYERLLRVERALQDAGIEIPNLHDEHNFPDAL